MLRRFAAVAMLSCGLGGCTDADWDHAMNYAGVGDKAQPQAAAPEAQPVAVSAAPSAAAPAAAPAETGWCATASKAAENEARELGFDGATQRFRAEQALRQCQSTP